MAEKAKAATRLTPEEIESWERQFFIDSTWRNGRISWKRAPVEGESFEDWYKTRNVLPKKGD